MSLQTDRESGTFPDSDIIWGAEAIGVVINRDPRQAYHLLEKGWIKSARKIGSQWAASRSALLRELGADALDGAA